MKDVNATIIIELKGRNKEDIWKNLEHSRRKNVTRALQKLSFEPAGKEEIQKSHEIYSTVWSNRGLIPEKYDEWKEKAESENFLLFFAKEDNKPIGCALIEKITRRYYDIDSDERGIRFYAFASDENFNELRPNDFLYWSSIVYALENNLDFVDLGGYQIGARDNLDGINRFKMQWGGDVFYFNKNYGFLKACGRKLIRKYSLFWWLNKKIKGRK